MPGFPTKKKVPCPAGCKRHFICDRDAYVHVSLGHGKSFDRRPMQEWYRRYRTGRRLP